MNPHDLNADTEALIQGYLEGTLTPEDSSRLLVALKSQPKLVGVLLDGLRVDALIREVVSQTEAASRSASTTILPERASEQRSRRSEEADQPPFSRLKSASLPRRLPPQWHRPAILALAACFVLMIGLATWYFGPTMGRPVLAELKGVEVSLKRGTEFVPATAGRMLKADDVLRLGTNTSATIAFGVERTRLELSAGTELKLTSLARGKQFVLQAGRIESSVARQRPFHPMIIATPQAEARVLGTKFTLMAATNATRLEVTEGNVTLIRKNDDAAVKVRAGQYVVAAANVELTVVPATGQILREHWTGIGGDAVGMLTTHTNYPDKPSGRDFLNSFEAPTNINGSYGTRIRGYLYPPKTGQYRFWIAADDSAELYLSVDDSPDQINMIASVYFRSKPREWTRYPWQQSSFIKLKANHRYYIELLHKKNDGAGHLAVAWQTPDGKQEIIPGAFLSPFKADPKEKKQ